MTFTIRGIELAASTKFIDAHWLPLWKLAAEAPLSPGETHEGRDKAAWYGLCRILPGAKQHADEWSDDGSLALSVYEIADVIGWAGKEIESRKSYKAATRPGFGELLAGRSVGMVKFGAEDVSSQMPDLEPYREGDIVKPGEIADRAAYEQAIAAGLVTELPPDTQAEAVTVEPYDAELITAQESSSEVIRQSRIEELRAELKLLGISE